MLNNLGIKINIRVGVSIFSETWKILRESQQQGCCKHAAHKSHKLVLVNFRKTCFTNKLYIGMSFPLCRIVFLPKGFGKIINSRILFAYLQDRNQYNQSEFMKS